MWRSFRIRCVILMILDLINVLCASGHHIPTNILSKVFSNTSLLITSKYNDCNKFCISTLKILLVLLFNLLQPTGHVMHQ